MLCFLILTALRAWKLHRYPIHSRLELYPVPKEGDGRAEYGGSYFEEPEWWNKPRAINRSHETRDILKEMLFIRKLFWNNRTLWWASYLFHLGIYALFAWTVLLLLATLWPFSALIVLALIALVLGFILATVGAILLLLRRILDTTLRSYTTALEYGNLLLILAVLITGLLSWTFITSPFQVASNLLFFGGLALQPLVIAHLILLSLMLIYIPLSKMSHYVGKFFAFHKVLWDNDPNRQGSEVNERVKKAAMTKTPSDASSAPLPNVQQSDSLPGSDEEPSQHAIEEQ